MKILLCGGALLAALLAAVPLTPGGTSTRAGDLARVRGGEEKKCWGEKYEACPKSTPHCVSLCKGKADQDPCAGTSYSQQFPGFIQAIKAATGKKGLLSPLPGLCGFQRNCGPTCVSIIGGGVLCPASVGPDYVVVNRVDPDSGDCDEGSDSGSGTPTGFRLSVRRGLLTANGSSFNAFGL